MRRRVEQHRAARRGPRLGDHRGAAGLGRRHRPLRRVRRRAGRLRRRCGSTICSTPRSRPAVPWTKPPSSAIAATVLDAAARCRGTVDFRQQRSRHGHRAGKRPDAALSRPGGPGEPGDRRPGRPRDAGFLRHPAAIEGVNDVSLLETTLAEIVPQDEAWRRQGEGAIGPIDHAALGAGAADGPGRGPGRHDPLAPSADGAKDDHHHGRRSRRGGRGREQVSPRGDARRWSTASRRHGGDQRPGPAGRRPRGGRRHGRGRRPGPAGRRGKDHLEESRPRHGQHRPAGRP